MKPRPLKDRMFYTDEETRCASDKCIKEAVEWLKKKLDETTGMSGDVSYGDLIDWIDKAFEDVTNG